MAQAKTQHLKADNQYSSSKNCSVIIQCLNKQLWYNFNQGFQIPAALCSNDVKSCYDQIVLLIAALCMCQLGATKNAVFSMIGTLVWMDHHI